MNSETAFTIMTHLDHAERTLGEIRLHHHQDGRLKERLATYRTMLDHARQHLEIAQNTLK